MGSLHSETWAPLEDVQDVQNAQELHFACTTSRRGHMVRGKEYGYGLNDMHRKCSSRSGYGIPYARRCDASYCSAGFQNTNTDIDGAKCTHLRRQPHAFLAHVKQPELCAKKVRQWGSKRSWKRWLQFNGVIETRKRNFVRCAREVVQHFEDQKVIGDNR